MLEKQTDGHRWLVWGGFALWLIAAPLLFPSSLARSILAQIGYLGIICLSYNLLLGQGGMLSFGHAVYTGLGSFMAIHAMNWAGQGTLMIPLIWVPLVGGLAGLLCAALLGFISTRKSGTTFAMITLGLGELVAAMALMFPQVFGGEGGITANRVYGDGFFGFRFGPALQVYYLIAAYAFVCTAALFAFTGTPLGKLLNAVRDNPERVAFLGHNPQRVRYAAFTIAGGFAGVGGALAAINFEIVTGADSFSMARSGSFLLFTFLGGATFFLGAVGRRGAAGAQFGAAVGVDAGLVALPRLGVFVHGDVCARRCGQFAGTVAACAAPAWRLGAGSGAAAGAARRSVFGGDDLPPATQHRRGIGDAVFGHHAGCQRAGQLVGSRFVDADRLGFVRAGAALGG